MKKKVNWIIDKYVFEDYEDRLVETIKRSGAEAHIYDDQKGRISSYLGKFFTDDIVIFHGSLQHGRGVEKFPIYPGIFLTLNNYECYKYYGYYGDNLLNSKYMMMGLNDVLRNKNRIFGNFGSIGSIFIRPSNGFKSFPGQLLPWSSFDTELDILTKSYGGLDLDELVVVSPLQYIEEEYRFIVINGVVVSGSLYMDNNNRTEWKAYYDKPCEDSSAFDFAIEMSKIYQPDKAFTIDVCKLSDGDYKMIEINSFCCASMYGCDYKKVVDAVNELCFSEYEDIYN